MRRQLPISRSRSRTFNTQHNPVVSGGRHRRKKPRVLMNKHLHTARTAQTAAKVVMAETHNAHKHRHLSLQADAYRLLLIEDVESDAILVELALRDAGISFVSRRVQTKSEFLHALKTFQPTAILADYHLPQFSALEALQLVKEHAPEIPFLLVTGSQSEEVAVECIKQGADDYLLKQSLTRLPSALKNAIKKREAEMEKENAITELKISRERLRALSAHIQSVREEERARIAREIHDELGQSLTALKMDIMWIYGRMGNYVKSSEQIDSTMKSMVSIIDSTINTVRRIATELRPSVLDDLGLVTAIEWQTQEFQNRTGIRCKFRSTTRELNLNREHSTAIFRILQETLTNVARHSRATQVQIRLEVHAHHITMEITDNGRGVTKDELENKTSLGLLGMKERAGLMGGTVEIHGSPSSGTTVSIAIPRASPEKKNGFS